ncbi:MAG: phosphotransferase [Actinomycetota bacterium]
MEPAPDVEVVVAHDERATLRVGGVFIKVDGDPARLAAEVAAMHAAPVPTAEILWHEPPALALQALDGAPLGRLGEASNASPAAWQAAGAAIRVLHTAPPPERKGRSIAALAERLTEECAWLEANDVLPPEVVERNRRLAEDVFTGWRPVFVHGDLQIDHVFVADDEVTGILDWSEASQGDAHADLATLTLGEPERLDDVLAGYGPGIDRDRVQAWWSLRCLLNVRWLSDHGFGPPELMPEVAVLRGAG